MVKGKYASASDRRREMEALTERAATAERERDRLAGELAAMSELREQEVASLRGVVARLREGLTEATSPRIAELEEQNNKLRVERDELATQLRRAYKPMRKEARYLRALEQGDASRNTSGPGDPMWGAGKL